MESMGSSTSQAAARPVQRLCNDHRGGSLEEQGGKRGEKPRVRGIYSAYAYDFFFS